MSNGNRWERKEGETEKAFAAFCAYLNLGQSRSLSRLSASLGKHASSLERWSAANDWVDRAAAWDAHLERVRRQAATEAARDEEITAYRNRARDNARRLNTVVAVLMKVCAERLKDLQPSDIHPRDLPGLIRAASQAMDVALNAEAQAIGATELMDVLDEISGNDRAQADG